MDAGLAAILGAIVGSGGALIAQVLRQSHEDRHRFTADKRSAYGDFLAAVDGIHRLGVQGRQRVVEAVSIAMLEEVSYNLSRSFQELTLLAPRYVTKAARPLYNQALGLGKFAGRGADDAAWEKAVAELVVVRAAFEDAARRDLRLPSE